MSLRPTQARWFETYLPREQTVRGVEVLARTGAVELETARDQVQATDVERLRYYVERFQQLAGAHARDLPRVGHRASALQGDPIELAEQALERLRPWADQVDLARARLVHLQAEEHYLLLLRDCLEAMARDGLDLERAFSRTRFLCKCLFACPRATILALPGLDGVEHVARGDKWDFLYVASLTDRRHLIRQLAVERGCEQIALPAWLSGDLAEQRRQLGQRLKDARREKLRRQVELRSLREDQQVAQDRADVGTLRWYLNHAAGTLGAGPMNRVTGWTTLASAEELRQALAAAGIRAIIRSPEPPTRLAKPVASIMGWWARPFRPLVEMLGPPGRQEVDPSGLLALVVPLLFGYMFPDLGHGLVLALAALLLSRHWLQTRFLVPCGIAAALFGLLAGEVFGLHGLIPTLWLAPLDAPLQILILPLGFGALLLGLSLVLAGIQAHWRGEGRRWLWRDGALLAMYVFALVGLLHTPAFWLAGLAALQYVIASLLQAPGRRGPGQLVEVLGELLLAAFELLINTLSFLRVGAFALGHGALSLAIVTLAESTGCPWGWWLVMVLGNVFALVLEGMLVFVQTTRLVLFEFFIRFLRGEGRLFRPVGPASEAERDGNGAQSSPRPRKERA